MWCLLTLATIASTCGLAKQVDQRVLICICDHSKSGIVNHVDFSDISSNGVAVPPICVCVCVFSAYVTSNSSCCLSFSVSFEPLLELLMSAQLQLVRPGTRRQLSSKVQAPLPSVISAAICLLSHYLSAWQQSVSCNL